MLSEYSLGQEDPGRKDKDPYSYPTKTFIYSKGTKCIVPVFQVKPPGPFPEISPSGGVRVV